MYQLFKIVLSLFTFAAFVCIAWNGPFISDPTLIAISFFSMMVVYVAVIGDAKHLFLIGCLIPVSRLAIIDPIYAMETNAYAVVLSAYIPIFCAAAATICVSGLNRGLEWLKLNYQ